MNHEGFFFCEHAYHLLANTLTYGIPHFFLVRESKFFKIGRGGLHCYRNVRGTRGEWRNHEGCFTIYHSSLI